MGCREGNGWSHDYCRRQWSLVDADHLRYKYMNAWDAAMQRLDQQYGFLSSEHLLVSYAGNEEQVCCFDVPPDIPPVPAAQLCFRVASRGIQCISSPRVAAHSAMPVTAAVLTQTIVAERGPLLFVFNFSPFNDYEGYKVSDAAVLPSIQKM